MSELPGMVAPGRTAVVLQEVQESVLGSRAGIAAVREAAEEVGVLSNLSELTTAARAAGVPVVHSTIGRLPGGFGTNRNARLFTMFGRAGSDLPAGSDRPVPEVHRDGDVVLPRYQGLGPFAGELDMVLRNAGISTVVATGVSLNIGVSELVFGLVDRGYDVVVPRDAVAGVPPEYGRQVLRNTIGLLATLTSSADLVAAWAP